MDLEELCRSEGLDPDSLDETVRWAKSRAEELIAGVVADSELGPILDAQWEDESGLDVLPTAAATQGAEATPAAEADAGLDALPAQAEPQASTQPRAELRNMLAEGARRAMDLPPLPGGGHAAPMKEMTQEIDADDIELLDDDDLMLVEDDDDDEEDEPAADAGGGGGGDEVPEWQQALNSAHLGGGEQADHDSGLLRMPKAAEPAPPDEDDGDAEQSSVDVDVSDL